MFRLGFVAGGETFSKHVTLSEAKGLISSEQCCRSNKEILRLAPHNDRQIRDKHLISGNDQLADAHPSTGLRTNGFLVGH